MKRLLLLGALWAPLGAFSVAGALPQADEGDGAGQGDETPPVPTPPPVEEAGQEEQAEDQEGGDVPAGETTQESGDESEDETKEGAEEGAKDEAQEGAGQETPPVEGDESSAQAAAADPAPPAPAVEPPARPLNEVLVEALRGLEGEKPDRARVEVLGHSRGGREIPLLLLGDFEAENPVARPAVLLIEESGISSAGARRLVSFARHLVARAEADPAVLDVLRRLNVLVAPMTDPDALVEGAGDVRFPRNFPLGWEPETVVPGGAVTPLATEGTRAFATLLQREKRLLYVLTSSPEHRPGRPFRGSELPREDRALFEELARLPPEGFVLPWHRLGSRGGSLVDLAYQAHGVPPLAIQAEAGTEDEWHAGMLELLVALGRSLPRIELVAEAPRRLGNGVWQVDVEIANPSFVPTLTELARSRGVPGGLHLTLAGASLVASAQRGPEPGSSFDETVFHAASDDLRLPLGILGGGEVLHLRLIVSGETESSITLRVEALRVGSFATELPLVEAEEP